MDFNEVGSVENLESELLDKSLRKKKKVKVHSSWCLTDNTNNPAKLVMLAIPGGRLFNLLLLMFLWHSVVKHMQIVSDIYKDVLWRDYKQFHQITITEEEARRNTADLVIIQVERM